MANKLIDEQSPYLLQHAHNPVDWYPWGDEAFLRAKQEHKPVLVSIGYAACHWCHVMERESFENEDVAAYMNEHFICIKVDREEHPDVDHIYMDAVQAIGGSGGWPLNVFVTPDRVPFYGGTYYPPRPAYNRPSWPQLLQRMSAVWTDNHDEVTLQAEQMVKHLQQASQRMLATTDDKQVDKDTCRQIADTLLKQADKEQGGFGNAPKFPGTMALSYLLEHYQFTGHEPSLKHALRSIDAMIEGGIYDQAGGGFARYATDREWLVPHFEKMLYDNALLVSALCDAYSITKTPRYKEVIEETIAFVERELKDASGGYYCALDADSEGVEGKFYTWTWEEWQAVMGDNEIAGMYFGITAEGNWEHTNILHVNRRMEDVAGALKVPLEAVIQQVREAKEKVMSERAKRVRPQTDDKSLLSWNALMNIALSKAGTVLQNEEYLHRATAHMQWMQKAFQTTSGALLHTWKQGTARITAKLDDHAYLIQAMLQLASATGDNEWIVTAGDLITAVVAGFSREDGFFYYTPATQQDIPVRKVDVYDGATPSANAVLAHSLWLCGLCMERTEWVERAKSMLKNMADTTLRYAYSFSYWALLLQRDVMGEKTVVCAGNEADMLRRQFRKKYLPHAFVLTCKKEISELPILAGKFLKSEMGIFVCTEQACLPPVHDIDDAIFLIYR